MKKVFTFFLVIAIAGTLTACKSGQALFDIDVNEVAKFSVRSGVNGDIVYMDDINEIDKLVEDMNSFRYSKEKELSMTGWRYLVNLYDAEGNVIAGFSPRGREIEITTADGSNWYYEATGKHPFNEVSYFGKIYDDKQEQNFSQLFPMHEQAFSQMNERIANDGRYIIKNSGADLGFTLQSGNLPTNINAKELIATHLGIDIEQYFGRRIGVRIYDTLLSDVDMETPFNRELELKSYLFVFADDELVFHRQLENNEEYMAIVSLCNELTGR